MADCITYIYRPCKLIIFDNFIEPPGMLDFFIGFRGLIEGRKQGQESILAVIKPVHQQYIGMRAQLRRRLDKVY